MSNRNLMVSCLMPTYNRPDFFRQSVKYFMRQTYNERQLIVIDDSDHRVLEELVSIAGNVYIVDQHAPDAEHLRINHNIVYHRPASRLTTGAKLNIAKRYAAGDMMCTWDDDDWYRDDYLREMVEFHTPSMNARMISALFRYSAIFVNHRPVYRTVQDWLPSGATYFFSRKLAVETEFLDQFIGIDFGFMRSARARYRHHINPLIYAHVRHGKNSWNELLGTPTDEFFKKSSRAEIEIEDLLGEDVDFYLNRK